MIDDGKNVLIVAGMEGVGYGGQVQGMVSDMLMLTY
jgi:hypothetical protein